MTGNPVSILLSATDLNLKTWFPFAIKLLFVSLYSGYCWYNFSSTKANISFLLQTSAKWTFWSSEVKLTATISLGLIAFGYLSFWISSSFLIMIFLYLSISISKSFTFLFNSSIFDFCILILLLASFNWFFKLAISLFGLLGQIFSLLDWFFNFSISLYAFFNFSFKSAISSSGFAWFL